MKTTQKITGVFIFLLLSQVTLYAQKTQADDAGRIAEGIVERLDKDVILTDSQKVVILEHAKVFAVKSQSTQNLTNNDATRMQRRNHVQEYKAAINEVLTNEQKEMLAKKREERREAVVKKYTSSQK